MVGVATSHGKTLERWSPKAFFIAGGLVFGHAAIMAVRTFTDIATPVDVFAPTGHFIALVGLFGLYHAIDEQRSLLGRGAIVAATISTLGWFLITMTQLGEVITLIPPQSIVLPDAVSILVIASTILTYILFGGTILRTNSNMRTVGALLLVPAGLFLLLIVSVAVVGPPAVNGLVFGGGLALTHLAIGYSLRTEARPPSRAAPATDTTP